MSYKVNDIYQIVSLSQSISQDPSNDFGMVDLEKPE